MSASSGLASLAAEADTADAPLPVSLYVHVPFCVSKCAYCDFYSLAGHPERHAAFVDAALFEAGHWSHYDLLDDVPTLYVGGGTPTVLGTELVRLVEGLRETAHLRADAEITVETNPETTDPALVAALVDAGVSRFSLGVQSFDDEVLRTLGRCHDSARARAAADVLLRGGAGFSIDLICGVPGQSFASWDDTLEQALATGARHVSVYPLSVEEGTPLAAGIAAGRIPEPDPDLAAEMMLAADVALSAAGMHRYEVANYAQPGHESRHNSVYWTGGPYLGVGPHAASMLSASVFLPVASAEAWPLANVPEDPARVRFTREADLLAWARRPLDPPAPFEFLSADEAAREDVMLGMRMTRGVSVCQAQSAGLGQVMGSLEADGLVRRGTPDASDVPRWTLTERGWLLGNRVFGAIWNATPSPERA
jgi:oxygen-independent coproporphyrinogen-3 oxidase